MKIHPSFLQKIACAFLLTASLAPSAEAEGRRLNVLFLGHRPGAHPGHITEARFSELYRALGPRGIDLEYTMDQAYALNTDTLKNFDALAVYANLGDIKPEQEKALFEYVESGHGFVPIHCASYCWLNSMRCTALIGGRFHHHDTGDFDTVIVEKDHPIMKGFLPFKTWDETYVHEFHNPDKIVLQRRVDAAKKEDEPWTWVRNQGKGRVFYTAYGHNEKTWQQLGFQDLIYRGIVWAVGDQAAAEFGKLKIKPLEYVDGAEVPNYERRNPPPKLQKPLTPEDAQPHIFKPADMNLTLFASEATSQGGLWNVIEFKFDERGRMWTCESRDYPNERKPQGEGRDRIRILEDTDGDGKADKFTIFAENISIPTSLVFYNGGVIVHTPPDTTFFKDTNGDDKYDEKEVLFSGWGTGDTHAMASSMAYGFDGWIYGCVGYSGFGGKVGGEDIHFGSGAYRFRLDGSKLEFLGPTSNNTWGFAFNEDGDIFGSTANNQSSYYCPIPRRYYETVPGLEQGILPGVDANKKAAYMREYIRQVDVMGGFTAAACHNFYTARTFPKKYWNKIAFVAEPTCHLLYQGVAEHDGSHFTVENGWNLLASDDEWFAPVYADVGPDGGVYVSDFYSFIIQHNPTPSAQNGGFDAKNGPGNAFVSDLRDTEHARLWKVFPKGGKASKQFKLSKERPEELLEALASDNLLWRKHAQRLLIERGNKDVVEKLRAMVADTKVDEVGVNGGAVGALWTLSGLGVADLPTLTKALKHPAAGVQRAAVALLPRTAEGAAALISSGLLDTKDALVKLNVLLAVSEMPASADMGASLYKSMKAATDKPDRWIPIAINIAVAKHAEGYLRMAVAEDKTAPAAAPEVSKNLLPNPSFEEANGDKPKNWESRTYGGTAEHVLDTAVAHTGKNSLRISSKDGSDTSWFTDVPLEANSTYLFSGFIKTDKLTTAGGAKGAMLELHQLNGTQPHSTPLKGNQDWTPVAVNFNSGPQTSVSLNLLFGGWGPSTGTAWWDDVSLVKTTGSNQGDTQVAQIASAFARSGTPEAKAAMLTFVRASKGGVADTISRALGGSGATEKAESLEELRKTHAVVNMKVLAGQLNYDKKEYKAPAGKPIVIVFENLDQLQHNVLVGKPGSLEKLGAATNAMMTAQEGSAKSYIPEIPETLAAVRLANANETLLLKLPALVEGEYPIICTFPTHWANMRAVLKVQK